MVLPAASWLAAPLTFFIASEESPAPICVSVNEPALLDVERTGGARPTTDRKGHGNLGTSVLIRE